eukprot:1181485-Prorocentrum_minimum.AAC.4
MATSLSLRHCGWTLLVLLLAEVASASEQDCAGTIAPPSFHVLEPLCHYTAFTSGFVCTDNLPLITTACYALVEDIGEMFLHPHPSVRHLPRFEHMLVVSERS